MVIRYPDTATLTFVTAGTYNTLRGYTAGTTITQAIKCHIQLNSANYIIDENGNLLKYNYNVFAPFFTDYKDVPRQGAHLRFGGNDHYIYQFWSSRLNISIKC